MLLLLELSSVFRAEGIVLAHGEQFEHRLCARGARFLAMSNAFELAGSAEYAVVVDDARVADRPFAGIDDVDHCPADSASGREKPPCLVPGFPVIVSEPGAFRTKGVDGR